MITRVGVGQFVAGETLGTKEPGRKGKVVKQQKMSDDV